MLTRQTTVNPQQILPTVKKARVVKLIETEKLSTASENREGCRKCNLFSSCRSAFSQPYVPDGWTKKLLLVGDITNDYERVENLYAGLAGQALKEELKNAGYTKSDIAFVPVLRCKPSKTPRMLELRHCAPFVYRAVEVLKPEYVLGLGQNAARSLSNNGTPGKMAKLRGREFTSARNKGFTYTLTSAVHSLATSPSERSRFAEDIARTRLPVMGYPSKGVPHGKGYIGFDTEYTPNEVLCGAVSDGNRALCVQANQLGRISSTFNASTLVGHNLPVDLDALLKAKVPNIKPAMERWLRGDKQRDTLLIAKLADENRGPGGYTLESLLLARYNVKDYKAPTERLGPDPTLWPVPLRDERCRLDAWATLKVYDALSKEALGPQHISHRIAMTLHRLWYTGVYISMPAFMTMKKETYEEEEKAKARLLGFARKHGMKDFTGKDSDIRSLMYDTDKLGLDVESTTKGGLPSASVKVLKEYQRDYPEIQAFLSHSKADKMKTTYCDGLEKKIQRLQDGRYWIPVRIGALATKTGRRNSSGPNFQNWPVRVRQIVVSRFKGGAIADNDYCVAPGTRVLLSDLTWKAAGDIKRGEKVIGFDENGTQRKFKEAVITSSKRLTRPCYKIITDKGEVTSSAEHRWLVRTLKSYRCGWLTSDAIKPGHTISFLSQPWEVDTSHEGGYLAGFLDGEGFVSGSTGFGQNKGFVSDYVQWLLKNRGFEVINYTSNGRHCEQVLIRGSLGEKLRLLGSIRPHRLLPKARKLWEGAQVWGKRSIPAEVLSVEYVGEQEVIALGTTTKTFIAEGFFSHNSKLEPIIGGWVTGERRLTEYFTKYPNGYIKIGEDFFKKSVEKGTKEYTSIKSLVLAILYNKKKWSLAEDMWVNQGVKLDTDYEKHTDKCGDLLERFLSELFPGVRRYHQRQEEFVLTHGYVDNAVGQRRRLPLPPEPPRSDKFAYKIFMRYKSHVINQSINYPIQSLASYVTGAAMVDLEEAFLSKFDLTYVEYHTALMRKEWPNMPLLCLEIHDDLVLDIPKGMEKKTKEITHDIMTSVTTLRKLLPAFKTPLSVDTVVAPHWGVK